MIAPLPDDVQALIAKARRDLHSTYIADALADALEDCEAERQRLSALVEYAASRGFMEPGE